MYGLAAGAAGVSVLALAQPSEARIVYTHVRKVIWPNSHFDLDLNHDGINDFSIRNVYKSKTPSLYVVPGPQGVNAVEGTWTYHSGRRRLAFALHPGNRIGPAKNFSGEIMARLSYDGPNRGYWWSHGETSGNPKPHYLGLKFQVKGKSHFGWARLIITVGVDGMVATLTSYAYETIANKPIKAGQKKETTDDLTTYEDPGRGASLTGPIPDTPRTTSLGVLALGAQGLPAWRRKDSVVATK
jgi:hypothetical protein